MESEQTYQPGDLVRARNRDWVVLPERRPDVLNLRPLGGTEDDSTLIYLPLEPKQPEPATFNPPDPNTPGCQKAVLLLRDALRLKLRAGAGPFRSFGNLNFEPRAYQLVPLLMALKQDTVRLLVADDVGIGKTIEAGLIARELLDRGEIERLAVICPPHLCEQWQRELKEKFAIDAEVVRTGTATRLERGLRPDESLFDVYPCTVVSLDYIKSDRRRHDFLRTCPEFVIVDEAHTCVQSNTNTRHQRYQLLKGLADSEPRRGIVFLTATPHSGDDVAFHNLLGLLEPKFAELADVVEETRRRRLREELALHFVQRRRGDIAEWKDNSRFPIRESREATYGLTGHWGDLFTQVITYARAMVKRTEGGTKLQQRLSWWAALALLRCISSSPAAASQALRTRLQAAEGDTERTTIVNLDQTVSETVMDESGDDSLVLTETVPAGSIEDVNDSDELRQLIVQADALRGPDNDPKLEVLIGEVRRLIQNGFRPVVFCRYIATAHYLGEELKCAKIADNANILVITGELTSDQREERIEALGDLKENIVPVLVATDCLSEGINLQHYFNAVIHYDLTWNPTRHEQREGRVDRFGQSSRTVRTLMLYGASNPVDGAVLRVILRKAEKIRKELGIAVPLPVDNDKVIDAIMKVVLLYGGAPTNDIQIDMFDEVKTEVDDAWQLACNQSTRTVFAQRRLAPDDVLPEWRKTNFILGGAEDVKRFVRLSAERFGAGLTTHDGYCRLPVAHLPTPLKDRLTVLGFNESTKISFNQPAPTGVTHIHRAHPLVAAIADHIAEEALLTGSSSIGARSGAIFTKGVEVRTVLYLLRLRNHIQLNRQGKDGRSSPVKSLLTEECLGVVARGGDSPELLTDEGELSLLSLEPDRNMCKGQQSTFVRQALESLPGMQDTFRHIAEVRAHELLQDHRRIRDASDIRGLRYQVEPVWPVDTIGVYVLMPVVSL